MSLIQEDVSLLPFNTFGLDVKARYFAEVKDLKDLKSALSWAQKEEVDFYILGGGSNILLTGDYEGLIIKNALKGIVVKEESEQESVLEVAGGEVWHELVMYCIENGWGGIENMSLIPGTVGAAPMQNIGAYGVEIKDVFMSLKALNRHTLELQEFDKEACQFGYRESVFKKELKNQFVIVSVTIRLNKIHQVNTSYGAINEVLNAKSISHPTIRNVSDAVIEIRQSKLPDPAKIGNSGSFFKNPVISKNQYEELKSQYDIPGYPQGEHEVKVPAGWLIEQSGWKGMRRGAIGVHDKQALVLVNYGGGQGNELYQLALDVKASVLEKFGIEINPEVNIL